MSHRPSIVCEECRMPLGELDESRRSIRLLSFGLTIVGPSSTAIECPRCRRTRIWSYQQTMGMTSCAAT